MFSTASWVVILVFTSNLKLCLSKTVFRISNTTCQRFYVFTIWNVEILSLSLNRESELDIINIQGAMFILMQFMGICNCSGILPYIFTERNVAYRERFSGMYSLWAFSFAQVLKFPKVVVSLLPLPKINVIFYILRFWYADTLSYVAGGCWNSIYILSSISIHYNYISSNRFLLVSIQSVLVLLHNV